MPNWEAADGLDAAATIHAQHTAIPTRTLAAPKFGLIRDRPHACLERVTD